MRGYLASYGIKESEAESFLEEAKVHLIEGEKNGKTVEDIFGKSPEKYAKELVSVLTVSKKGKYQAHIKFNNSYFLICDHSQSY